ncbi:bestrophin family protein [Flavobacterium sp.]|uniref:bestrophin family protein n=1 Tax=Flavobacterium sp. TaxID=239 RepID=UPI0026268593|nr:bestrophin family ion channel [Flavobacterium sp.]
MYTGKDFTVNLIWHFARKNLLRTAIISTAAVVLYKYCGFTFLAIPFVPIASVGTAVAFYVGFKNNQAYDRLWEARKLWGGITNTSRNFACQALALIEDKEIAKELIYRHIAYVNILRLQLRKTIPWATSKENLHQTFHGERSELDAFDEGLKKILEQHNKLNYYEKLKSKNNAASGILKSQIFDLTKLKREKKIDEYEHSDLVKHINELFNLQGGCERIKSTPLFRQYSIFSRVFVVLFIALVPFGLMKDLSQLASWGVWLTIPFSMMISWVFFTMEQIGEFSENPFDNSVNDIPIYTICVNIEIDLKELMDEENLPDKVVPENNVLL